MNAANIHILLADDDEDILELIEYNLKNEGYIVSTASDGTEAIKKAIKINPDLIILDVMMPEMNGVDVCVELREKEAFKDTLITFLTARDDDFSQITCFDAGGDDFISKPVKPKVLLSRIKALLKRTQRDSQNSNLVTYGPFSVNKESYELKYNSKLVPLSKKEFKLFNLLFSKPGKVFTREEIFKKVWGSDVIVGDRTIDVHIRKLREKTDDQYIRTMKGIGYSFIKID
jgi:two-component system alkaline phosphatase synthesis response regulator PhoP